VYAKSPFRFFYVVLISVVAYLVTAGADAGVAEVVFIVIIAAIAVLISGLISEHLIRRFSGDKR